MNQDCVDLIRQGVGQGMTDEEIVALYEKVKKTRRKLELQREKVADLGEALTEAAGGIGDRMAVEAVAKKRALAMQAGARIKAVDYVLSPQWRGMEDEALMSFLGGTNYSKSGSRLSIDAVQKALLGKYAGGMLADLQDLGPGPFRLFAKGTLDREIARALESLDSPAVSTQPGAPGYSGPTEALALARVLHKWQERARSDQNRSGAWIGKMPGYITRQGHDRSKIRTAGFKAWAADITPLLDWDRIAEDWDLSINREEFLQSAYQHITTGVRDGKSAEGLNSLPASALGNVAARASRERVLHFKNADAWFDYNARFGLGSLRDSVLHGLQNAAQNTALMRALGPAPQYNFDAIFKDVQQALSNAGDLDGVNRLTKRRGTMNNLLKEVDGTINIDGNPTLAAVGRAWRSLENMSKLGAAVVSATTDTPVFSSEMAYQGRSFLGSMGEGIASLVKGRGSADERRVLSSLGVFYDGMCGDITARFTGEDVPGKLTWMQNLFFKLNGLTWWTDSWRKTAGLMMSHDLAFEKILDWGALKPERQRVFNLYGIDADRWDIIRTVECTAADGRDYLTPDALDSLPPQVFADYLVKRGRQATASAVDDLRFEIMQQFRTYFRDRIDYAVLNPDARTRSVLRQGTAAGTLPGEALRFVGQFKSFPAVMIQKTWGREWYGRGADNLKTALRSEHGEMRNFARLVLTTTLFGYGAMVVKDMLKGRTPRDPADCKTWIAAASQGGGMGIMGDFLFGEANRMGGGIVASMLGPGVGTFEDLHNIFARIRDGDSAAQASLRFAFNHAPGNNLYWFRTAFDYLIGYTLFDMINPGSFDRMRRRVERENGQTFMLRPVQW